MKNNLKANLFFSTFYQILSVVYPLITAPYISRMLGAENIGIYSYTESIQQYFAITAVLGTSVYGTREIAKHRNDVNYRTRLFWEIELLSIFTTFISLVAYLFIVGLSNGYRLYFIILSINIIAKLFDISWFYGGLEEFKYIFIINSFIKTAGVIAQLLLVKRGGLITYMVIITLITLLSNISMWLFLRKFLCKVEIKELHVFRHLKGTLVYFIPTIASTAYSFLDKTVLGLVTESNMENGYYEQATKIITLAQTVTFSGLNAVIQSRNSFLYQEHRYDEMRLTIKKSISYIMFMGIGIAFGIIGVADKFVPFFFGEGYDKVHSLLYVLCPIVLISGLSGCISGQYYTPSGRRKESSYYLIIGLLVNLILNILLTPRLLGNGAAISSIIGEMVILVLYVEHCKKFIYMKSIILSAAPKKIFAGMSMLALIILIGNAINNVIVCLALQVSLGFLTYVIVLYVLKDEFFTSTIKK